MSKKNYEDVFSTGLEWAIKNRHTTIFFDGSEGEYRYRISTPMLDEEYYLEEGELDALIKLRNFINSKEHQIYK